MDGDDGAREVFRGAGTQGQHQHTPLVYGARDKVERVAGYCSGNLPQGGRSPLFARRGLFRV